MVGVRKLVLVVSMLGFVATACPPDPGPPTLPSSPALSVGAGFESTCALLEDTTVRCWGNNAGGALGNGTNTDSSVPVAVTGVTGATQLSTGGGHSCVVLTGGTVKCWGNNFYFQLGNPAVTAFTSNVAVPVPGITGAVQVASGYVHTCARLSNGTVKCWGANSGGLLGGGTPGPQTATPVTVVGITEAVDIAVGYGHACAVLGSGEVKCWGNNSSGQLGDGNFLTESSTPVFAVGVVDATQVTAGYYHSCALVAGGSAKCWGINVKGQIGNGTTNDAHIPVTVTGLNGADGISGGQYHTCAVYRDDPTRCWGDNSQFQLGDGTSTNRLTPTVVSNLGDAAAIAAGSAHTCIRSSFGDLQCWGSDSKGQLGNGQVNGPAGSSTPVPVVGFP